MLIADLEEIIHCDGKTLFPAKTEVYMEASEWKLGEFTALMWTRNESVFDGEKSSHIVLDHVEITKTTKYPNITKSWLFSYHLSWLCPIDIYHNDFR